MTLQGRSIAIVGAGIGGLTAAAALRQFGIEAAVYEQAPALARIGAGIHVAPNAVKALMGSGMPLATVAAVPMLPGSSRHRDGYSGELTADLPLGAASWRQFGAPYTTWHRGDLHQALTALVPPGSLHLGKRLVDLEAGADSVVLQFADGTATAVDVLIAADGIHSLVRQLVLAVDEPHNTKRVAYRAIIERAAVQAEDLDPCTKWWGTDRHFVHYLVSAGRELAFTTSVPDPDWSVESWSAKGDVDELRSEFADFHPHVGAILSACQEVHKWAIHTREPLERWSHGRVVLIGDACHTMPPYMGQGGAMAMEDAVVLARCLAAADSDSTGLTRAFETYEATRRVRTGMVQATSDANTFGRYSNDVGWVYGYDAWAVPLAEPRAIQVCATDQP